MSEGTDSDRSLGRREDRVRRAVQLLDELRRVLELHSQGYRCRQIAGLLGLGTRTVRRRLRFLGLVKEAGWRDL